MADRRDAARERARDVAQQRAAATAARAAATPPPAVAPEPAPSSEQTAPPDPDHQSQPAPLPEPEPEAQAEQPAPALESPPPMPVPDPPGEDTGGSYTVTVTTETDQDADSSSVTITSSGGVGYSVDLEFPKSPPDGMETGPLDSEDAVPEGPAREEPLPPPEDLPTPAEQPAVATGADPPVSPEVNPAVPPQAADGGPVVPGSGSRQFVREVRPDPLRDRLEAAAEKIQLPGQSGAGLAAEVTQGAEVQRATGVTTGRRPGLGRDDSHEREDAGSLDVFASRFAASQAGAGGARFERAAAIAGDGPARFADISDAARPAAVTEQTGTRSETLPVPLPPGFRAEESAAETPEERHFKSVGELFEPEVAIVAPNDLDEPEVDYWALHRTRLSLIDPPTFDVQERDDTLPHELPEPVQAPSPEDD